MAWGLWAFNNYMDQNLPNFDPPPPSSRQKWTLYPLSLDPPWTFQLTPIPLFLST